MSSMVGEQRQGLRCRQRELRLLFGGIDRVVLGNMFLVAALHLSVIVRSELSGWLRVVLAAGKPHDLRSSGELANPFNRDCVFGS